MEKNNKLTYNFQTNLFCIINNAKENIIVNYGNSKVIFVNRGKQYNIPFLESSGIYNTLCNSENIHEMSIISQSFENAFHIADLIKCSMTVIRSEKSLDLECLRNVLAEILGHVK